AERNRQIEPMRAAADVIYMLALDVHAADEDGFGPFEFFFGRGTEILVDELDLPFLRQIGRDQEQSLRRHESSDAVGQRIGIFECAEGRCVTREDTKNMTDRSVALSSHRTSSSTPCNHWQVGHTA